jgi:hypothetical protein
MYTRSNPKPSQLGERLVSSACALLTVSLLAAFALPTRSLAQVPTFNTVVMTPTGSQPWQPPRPAAVGDFNGDGKLDALIVDGSPSARFMRGNGDGTFSEINIDASMMTTGNMVGLPANLVQYLPKSIDGYVLMKAADVNGDGKLDAVCVTTVHINFAPYSLVTVLNNTGNDVNGVPQFSTTDYFLGFYDVRSLTVGDLNGDGKPDIIVGSAYGGLNIYRNNGVGTFTLSQVTTIMPNAGGPAVGQGVIADVNGDGKADFVVTSGQANATDVFLGNGDGTLQAPTIISPAASCIAVADLNKDGKPDLIEGLGDGSVAVYLGIGNGTFGSPVNFPSGASSWPSGFFISDVNGDGNLDVAVSLPSLAKVAILTGNGDGTLSAPSLFGSIPNPVDVTLADFTGDGKPEIASVSANGYGGQNYAVFVNTTPFAPPPPPAEMFFTDTLTGPSSPNLATIPAGKYTYTASGLQRSQSSSDTDRPVVTTGLSTYLTTNNFIAEVSVMEADNDILYFGVGQGDSDPSYNNEAGHAFYFRVHNNFVNGGGGYYGIQADVRGFTGDSSAKGYGNGFQELNTVGNYSPGSTITLRIVRNGDTITMSIVGGGSVSYSLSAYPALGLTDSNTRVFFGNTSVGSVFSNLKIYPMPQPVVTSDTVSGGYGSAFSYSISATESPTSYAATGLPSGLTLSGATISGTLPNTVGTLTINLSASNAGGTGTGTLTINVVDTIPPVITAPSAITAEATSPAGAVVTFTATANDVISGVEPVTATPPSGSTFGIGLSTVGLIAADAAGNKAYGTINIKVVDTTPPTLTVPASQTIEATSASGATATFTATATDAVGVTSLTYSQASGSTIPIGTTTEIVTA